MPVAWLSSTPRAERHQPSLRSSAKVAQPVVVVSSSVLLSNGELQSLHPSRLYWARAVADSGPRSTGASGSRAVSVGRGALQPVLG